MELKPGSCVQEGAVKIRQIEVSYRSQRPGDYPPETLAEVAFLGRSNVGKSSLINTLVGRRKVAATSRTPGKTQTINWYRLTGDSGSCFFVDLPGYGYAKVPKRVREEVWARLIDTYLTSARPLVLAIQLLDMRRDGPTDLDRQMIDWLREAAVPHVWALTKADKLKRSRRAAAERRFEKDLDLDGKDGLIPFSTVTGEGKHQLWSLIDRQLAQAQAA